MAPLILSLPTYSSRGRVLAFDPVRGAPRAVARIPALRHDALKAELAGVLEDERAVLDHPEAVVLDLVHPLPTGRRLRGLGGKARRYEARREGTRTQEHGMKALRGMSR